MAGMTNPWDFDPTKPAAPNSKPLTNGLLYENVQKTTTTPTGTVTSYGLPKGAPAMTVFRGTGSPYGMLDTLLRQYTPQQLTAGGAAVGALAEANKNDVGAGLMPDESKARNALALAQSQLAGNQAAEVAANAASDRALQASQAGQNRAQAGMIGTQASLLGLTRPSVVYANQWRTLEADAEANRAAVRAGRPAGGLLPPGAYVDQYGVTRYGAP